MPRLICVVPMCPLVCMHARTRSRTVAPLGFFHTAEDEKENEGKRTHPRSRRRRFVCARVVCTPRKSRSRCIAIPTESGRWYYRVYCADSSQGDVVDKLREMFDKVFHQMSMRVVVEHAFEEGSHVAETGSARGVSKPALGKVMRLRP